MPKPKTLLKQYANNNNKKHKGKDTPVLETADDFLAVGVEYEDSAGKWRAGDAVKALRFFARAVNVYDQGLARFPGNFDLAYNKARVQLEVATHPLLVDKLDLEHSGNASTEAEVGRTAEEDQWFAIVEPVTKDTLIDTLLTQIGTLTTLCDVLASLGPTTSPSLPWIEEFSQTIINKKLPAVANDADAARQAEIRLAIARFASSLLEAGFMQGSLDAATFKRERDNAFDLPEVTLTGCQSYDGLVANAESLAAFESAVAEILPGQVKLAAMRWQALVSATSCLATAAKLTGNTQDDTAKTHLLRGNASLHQYQMAAPPLAYAQAISNKTQLLKNAEVFYRNASKLYQDEEQKAQADLWSSLVQALNANDADGGAKLAAHPRGQAWVRKQMQNMLDEGLLPEAFQL
ncbi:hypothetical protein DV736_g3547, partial [Chaetothyriales sp. CBS 134916]